MASGSSSLLPNWKASNVALATVSVVSVAVAFWLLFRFRFVLIALFIALVISTAINPAVFWLQRRGFSRAVGVILIYLLILALFAGFIWLIAPVILDQVADMSEVLPVYYQQFRDWLLDSPSFLIRMIGVRLPRGLSLSPLSQPALLVDLESEQDLDGAAIREQIAQAMPYAATIIRGLFVGLAVILLAFYWTLDGQRTIRYWLLLVPQNKRENIRGIYVRGIFLLSLIVGAMALVAYGIIGLPYALPLAIVAGVFEAVPIVGPVLGAIPAITIALGMGEGSLVTGVFIATLLIQAMENYILAPRILGHSVGVNPLVTILALVAFTSLLGFAGALLAIPLAAVFRPLIQRLKILGLPQIIAVLLPYFITIAALAGLLYLSWGSLSKEVQLAADNLVVSYDRFLVEWSRGSAFQQTITDQLPQLADFPAAIAGEQGEAFLIGLFGFTSNLFAVISSSVIVLVLSMYWSADRIYFERFWLSILPVQRRTRAREAWRDIRTNVGEFLRSDITQLLTAVILLALLYRLTGIQYPTLLALLCGLAWLIPWVGALLAMAPPFLIGLETNLGVAIVGALVTLLVLFFLEFVVERRIVNKRSYNSLLVVLA
jgi:predicted PurR-regulated permease PerM